MPALGLASTSFACADAEIAEEESDPVSLDKPSPLQLVDARAKPWHDGGEVACALDGDFERRRDWASCSEHRASQLILTPMGVDPAIHLRHRWRARLLVDHGGLPGSP